MSKYKKENPRIPVRFIDDKTEEVLFELKDKTSITVGEIFSNYIGSSIIEDHFKGKKLPRKVLVIAIAEFTLED